VGLSIEASIWAARKIILSFSRGLSRAWMDEGRADDEGNECRRKDDEVPEGDQRDVPQDLGVFVRILHDLRSGPRRGPRPVPGLRLRKRRGLSRLSSDEAVLIRGAVGIRSLG